MIPEETLKGRLLSLCRPPTMSCAWMPDGGLHEQRPRPRERGKLEDGGLNSAFTRERGEQEAWARGSGTTDQKH